MKLQILIYRALSVAYGASPSLLANLSYITAGDIGPREGEPFLKADET